jgi:RNA polymerase sigma factor (sigma-70 family)
MTRPGAPGTAPPIREVSSEEVARHAPLVTYTLNRMRAKGQLTAEIEWDDAYSVGLTAVWKALRRWQPERGTQSTYLSQYIWGHVMHHQRTATKATGWHRRDGRIAMVGSWEREIAEDHTLRETLAAPDDTGQQATAVAHLADLHAIALCLEPRRRLIALNLLADQPMTDTAIAARLGISRGRVSQLTKDVRRRLQTTPPPTGVLLVDRTVHPTEREAIREARRIRPGCTITSIHPKKVRAGRVVAPQGRPATDGSLGRPVWALEIAA